MKSSTTNINDQRIPFKSNVFLFGHEHDEKRSVKQFHKYTHKPIDSSFSIDDDSDDDDHLIMSGRSCLLCVCKCVLLLGPFSYQYITLLFDTSNLFLVLAQVFIICH